MGGQHGRLRGELGAALRTDHSWEVLEAGRGVALKLPRPGIEGREGGLGEAPGGRTVMEEARWVVGRGERGGGGVMRAVVPTRTRAHSSGHGQ